MAAKWLNYPGSLIAAEKVEGTSVYNLQGRNSALDDIMIDKVSGKAITRSCRSAASSTSARSIIRCRGQP
jgi:hypothetical protein